MRFLSHIKASERPGILSIIGTESKISHEQNLKVIKIITEAKTVAELFESIRGILNYTAYSSNPIRKYNDSHNGKTDPTSDFALSKGTPFWLTELREIDEFTNDDG